MATDGRLGKMWESVSAIIRRIGNPVHSSEFLLNRVEVIELIGVPGGI
jgi:hypothetical protein